MNKFDEVVESNEHERVRIRAPAISLLYHVSFIPQVSIRLNTGGIQHHLTVLFEPHSDRFTEYGNPR